MNSMKAGVAVSLTAYSFDKPYTYSVPDEYNDSIKVGSRVIVSFGKGNRKRVGIVLSLERMTDEDIEDLKILADEFKQFHIERNIQGMIEKDIEFHDKIFVTTKNEKLYQISQSLREQIYRFRVRYISEYDQSKNLIMEHDKILKAIINRDRKMAYNYGWEHIDNLRKHVKNSVKSKTE